MIFVEIEGVKCDLINKNLFKLINSIFEFTRQLEFFRYFISIYLKNIKKYFLLIN